MAIDPSSEDVEQVLKDATGGLGVDVAIETSAVYQALDQAIRGLAFNGTVAVAGWAKECTGGLDLGAVAHFSIPNRDHPRWDFTRIRHHCWQWLSAGKINCEEIVSPVVSFAEAVEAYQEMDLHPERSVKLGVSFGDG